MNVDRVDRSGASLPLGSPDDRGVDVVSALRRYRAAELAMRRRTRGSLSLGETDLLALRLVVDAEQQGVLVTAKDLSQRLDISSASTTVLIDRLERAGRVARRPHPSDRRAVVVAATPESAADLERALGDTPGAMLAAAAALDERDAEVVIAFLERMRQIVEAAEAEDERSA